MMSSYLHLSIGDKAHVVVSAVVEILLHSRILRDSSAFPGSLPLNIEIRMGQTQT